MTTHDELPRTIVAIVRALPAEEGGSPHPFFTGYRPLMKYSGIDGLHDVVVAPDDGVIRSGNSARCTIKLIHPEYHRGMLSVGASIELRDGNQVRATGIVEALSGHRAEAGTDETE